jgi:hypothetical protein
MMSRSVAVLGLVALAACAGCASGTRSYASNPNVRSDVGMQASPSIIGNQNCQGWYDAAAGACDSMGD